MKITIFLTLLFIATGCNLINSDKPKVSPDHYALLKKYTADLPDSTQLALAVIVNDKPSYFGFVKMGDTLIYAKNKDSVFEVGSITKIFTSTLLTQLILEGRIDPDKPVENYLQFPLHSTDYKTNWITPKTLANHTSGFPRMPGDFQETETGNNYNTIHLTDYLKNNLTLNSKPGTSYKYSNFAFATLGYLIGEIQKTDYENLLQSNICLPYHLTSTTTNINLVKEKLVDGRDPGGKRIPNKSLEAFVPAGGIYSSVSDLVNFIQANFKPDTVLDFQRKETFGQGNFRLALGWHIYKNGRGDCKWFSHNGGMPGYRSSIFMDVPSKSAVIILSNLSNQNPRSNNIDRLAHDMMKQEFIANNQNEQCGNTFIELALKKGWGAHSRDSLLEAGIPDNSIVGVWQQQGINRVNIRTFFPGNKVQTDFYRDPEMDVWGYYSLNNDTVTFSDIGGAACPEDGVYTYKLSEDTLTFTMIKDNCDGRIAGLSEKWVRMKK